MRAVEREQDGGGDEQRGDGEQRAGALALGDRPLPQGSEPRSHHRSPLSGFVMPRKLRP